MSAPSCRPRLVRAMSSAAAALTASSKNSSKKSPMRKNNRQPGWARLISRYCAITGDPAAPAAVPGCGGGSARGGEVRSSRRMRAARMADSGGRLTVACGGRGERRMRGSAWSRLRRLSRSVREAVASFPDRGISTRAVSDLLAAGFAPSDLSVLASHDSLAVAGEPGGAGSRDRAGRPQRRDQIHRAIDLGRVRRCCRAGRSPPSRRHWSAPVSAARP